MTAHVYQHSISSLRTSAKSQCTLRVTPPPIGNALKPEIWPYYIDFRYKGDVMSNLMLERVEGVYVSCLTVTRVLTSSRRPLKIRRFIATLIAFSLAPVSSRTAGRGLNFLFLSEPRRQVRPQASTPRQPLQWLVLRSLRRRVVWSPRRSALQSLPRRL